MHRPGQLFLFRKAEINSTYNTVCVQILKVQRCLYLREKTLDTLKDVCEECLSSIARDHQNFSFAADGINVPKTCEHLLVQAPNSSSGSPHMDVSDLNATVDSMLGSGGHQLKMTDRRRAPKNGLFTKTTSFGASSCNMMSSSSAS